MEEFNEVALIDEAIPRRLENPEEADYTNQHMHFLLSSGRARLFAF